MTTQAVILSVGCARDDGAVFPVTAKLKGGAVGNVRKNLLKLGLIEEFRHPPFLGSGLVLASKPEHDGCGACDG